MARFGVVGDLHGNGRWASTVLRAMGNRKITHVFVVGDFGLWTHYADGQKFLDEVQAAAEDNDLTVIAVGGNHENWDHWNWFVENFPTHRGMAMVRRRVLLAPKVHQFRLFNKQFVVAGGAVSIDKAYRLQRERGTYDPAGFRIEAGTGPRTLWWPNETLTDEDEQKAIGYGKCDILLTHDCSDATPWKSRLKPDIDSTLHRQRIDNILRAVRPEVHFHGHMHEKYDWLNRTGAEHWTQTYGLACDGVVDSWGVFDTDTDEFAFMGQKMVFRSLEETEIDDDF